MKKIALLLFALMLTACASKDKGMPEEVRKRLAQIPLIDVNNLSAEDEVILKGKQMAFLNSLADWGFDPAYIGNYHIDLGCHYFLEKILPYRKTERTQHTEFFVFRDYTKQFEHKDITNSSFCNPLRTKLVTTMSEGGHFAQKLYTITFTPNDKNRHGWDVSFKAGRFIPVDIKGNLNNLDKTREYIALRGEEDKEQRFLVYGCSKYRVPYPVFENGKVVGYENKVEQKIVEAVYYGELDYHMNRNLASAVLRESEHWVKCQERVKFTSAN